MMFNIMIETWADLDVDQIWPDGDAPVHPTAADVVAVLESCGGDPIRVLRDWGILDEPSVTVTGQVQADLKKTDVAEAWVPARRQKVGK